jgi:hypothetical protein
MTDTRTRRAPRPEAGGRRRYLPRLERLEGRECPATLSVGTNLNLTQLRDNQTEGTIAIDPTDPDRMFVASMSFHGGYVGTAPDGLFASYTTTGANGTWYDRSMATGGPGGDDLPMALGRPNAAFDDFGNLFLTYFTASPLQMGTSTGATNTTLTDSTRNWGTNEFSSHGNGYVDVWWTAGGTDYFQRRSISSNNGTTLTISSPWDNTPPAGADYFIHHDAGAHSVVVAVSADGGQTFSWLANFALSAGTTGPGTSYWDDQPRIATGPGGETADGSVWVYWHNTGVGSSGVRVAGAPVTGLGSVGSFGTPQYPSNAAGKRFGSIAVGPDGQLLLAYQGDLEMMSWPYHATVYTALDPDGLGSSGFNSPVNTVWTNVTLQHTIPASPNKPVNAAADLAWDRSGGANDGRVYLAYTDRPSLFTSDTNIMIRYSDNDGSTWSSATRLNDDTGSTNQFWPSIAVDQETGDVAAVWYDARNDPTNNTTTKLYGTASDDGGATYAANVAVSAGTSSAPAAETHMKGTSTGGNGARTLNDTTQNWATNWWGPPGSVPLTQVIIVAGTGANPNDIYHIDSNTATQITVDRDWAVVPDATSVYQFTLRYQYAYGGYIDLAFHDGAFYPVWADNSNSTLDNPDGANKPLDIYTVAVTVTASGGRAAGGRTGGPGKKSAVDLTGLIALPDPLPKTEPNATAPVAVSAGVVAGRRPEDGPGGPAAGDLKESGPAAFDWVSPLGDDWVEGGDWLR